MIRPRRSAGWWVTLAVFVACLGLVGFAVASYVRPSYRTPRSIGQVPSARPVAAAAPVTTGTTIPSPPAVTGLSVGAVPTALSLPALGISAPVEPEGLVADGATDPLAGAPGTLQIPDDPKILAWWQDGAAPGASTGTVVIAGHVDTATEGDGALYHLASAAPGQTITVATAGASVSYRIVARQTYVKAALPPSIFTNSGSPRLVVITCGGDFDPFTHHYADNVVVYAVPD